MRQKYFGGACGVLSERAAGVRLQVQVLGDTGDVMERKVQKNTKTCARLRGRARECPRGGVGCAVRSVQLKPLTSNSNIPALAEQIVEKLSSCADRAAARVWQASCFCAY